MLCHHTYNRVIVKGETAINGNGPVKYIYIGGVWFGFVIDFIFDGGNRQLGTQVTV